MKFKYQKGCLLAGLSQVIISFSCYEGNAQEQAVMQINTGVVKNTVAPTLHGIFFEEISHGGEGGLYGEMIQNRGFEENRIPPGTTLEDGFIVPKRTPH